MEQNQQQELAEFVQWLPSNIAQFQGQVPDEIIQPIAEAQDPKQVVEVLNELSQSEEGKQLVSGMFQAFQQSKQGMFKTGGKLAQGVLKFQDGGKARRFYSNWSESEIKKLQYQLKGRGYDVGDVDGKIGPRTINAVKAYQRDHKLNADGMFGHNTNSIENLVGSDVVARGRYAPTHATENGDLTRYDKNWTNLTVKDIDPELFTKYEIAYTDNPMDLFSEKGEAFRNVLNNSGDTGKMYLDRYYAMLTPEEKKQVDSRMKTNEMKTTEMVNHIHEGQNQVIKPLGAALALPFAVGGAGASLAAGWLPGTLGLIGGYYGGKWGGRRGWLNGVQKADKLNNNTNEFGYTQVYQDPIAAEYGVGSAIYDPERTRRHYGTTGQLSGSIGGAAFGAGVGSALGAGVESGLATLTNLGGRITNTPMKIDYSNQNYLRTTTGSLWGDAKMAFEGLKGLTNRHFFRYGNGQSRATLPHGAKLSFDGKSYNSGSFIKGDTAAKMNDYYNNPFSPITTNFGGSSANGYGSAVGTSFNLNPVGMAYQGLMTAPMGAGSAYLTQYKKRGGRILKSQWGSKVEGKKDPTFEKTITVKGDTLATKKYRYSTHDKRAIKDGPAYYTISRKSDMHTYYDPTREEPTFWQKFWNNAWKPADQELIDNWSELEKNHANDPVDDKSKAKATNSTILEIAGKVLPPFNLLSGLRK